MEIAAGNFKAECLNRERGAWLVTHDRRILDMLPKDICL